MRSRMEVVLIYLPVCKTEMHLTKWPVHYVKHKPKNLPITTQLDYNNVWPLAF